MSRLYRFSTASKMIETLTERLAWAHSDKVDMITSGDVQLHNTLSTCSSFQWEADLKRYMLGITRWQALSRQYVNPDALDQFIAKASILKNRRGIAMFRSNEVQMVHRKIPSRRWGSCILTLSYRSLPRPKITLHSRASYLGGLSVLDLTVAHLIAKKVGEQVGVEVEEMAFDWFAESLLYHGIRCIGWAMVDPDMRQRVLTEAERHTHHGVWMNLKHWNKIIAIDEKGTLYRDMTFDSNKRVRRKLHTEVFGPEYGEQFATQEISKHKVAKPLPHLLTSQLTLDSVYRER